MDEYTFLVMAKLRADRLRVERLAAESEQRPAAVVEGETEGEASTPKSSQRPSARAGWLDGPPIWGEQS